MGGIGKGRKGTGGYQILCVTRATVQAGESCLNASGRRVASDKPSCAQGNNSLFDNYQEGTIKRNGVISQIYVCA